MAETILLVENENALRELVRRFLEGSGYEVLNARDGDEALALATAHPASIDLLLTDVVMPGMTTSVSSRSIGVGWAVATDSASSPSRAFNTE